MLEHGKDFVSVVVLSYNSSKFIVETLESIKRQTYPKIELIVSDDCSKDDTIEVATSWLELNRERFVAAKVVTSEKNTGIPANCNRAYRVSTGRYVKIIAADDLLMEHGLTLGIEAFEQTNAEMVYGKMLFINEEGALIKNKSGSFPEFFSKLTVKQQLKAYCRNPEFVNIPTWFVRRDLVDRIGGYDETYFLLEDQISIVRSLCLEARIIYIEQELVKYRIHSSSSIVKYNRQLLQELIRARYEERWVHLNKWNLKDLMYMVDDYLHYYFAHSKHRKLLYITRVINPAFWMKLFIVKAPNTAGLLRLKKILA